MFTRIIRPSASSWQAIGWSGCLWLSVAFVCCSSPAGGQTTGGRPSTSSNGQLLEGLFREIISAQNQRVETSLRPVDRPGASQPPLVPTRVTPNTPAFSRPPGSIPPAARDSSNSRGYYPDTSSLRSFQLAMDGYAQQAGLLSTRAQSLANSLLPLRPLLPDIYRIKASADMLATAARRAVSFSEVYSDYLDLDWRWRNLSYQLHQINGFDSATQQAIRQIDTYGDQIIDILGVEPQFDRQGMLEQMTLARAYINALLDNIRFEVPASAERNAIINDGMQLEEQIRREGDFVRTGRYDEIAPRYTEFVTAWRQFSAKLFPYKNSRINRDIARIRQCGADIYRLLWMPAPLDRGYLRVTVDAFQSELAGWLQSISLSDFAKLTADQQQQALSKARELDVQAKQFGDAVRARAPLADLQNQFRRISSAREQLDGLLGPTTSDVQAGRRELVESYDLELRDLLQIPQAYDRSQAIQLAAALEGLADALKQDVHRFGPYFQNGTFRNQAYQAVDTFHRQTQQLNSALASGSDMEELKNFGNTMLTTWNSVMRMVAATPSYGLDNNRFLRLDQTRQEIMPLTAELATMFTY